MAQANYTLLLAAKLDSASMQAELNRLKTQNKIVMNLDFNTNDLQQKLQEIRATVDKAASLKISGTGSGEANAAVLSYKNAIGQSVTESYKLLEVETKIGNQTVKTEEWKRVGVTAIDNMAQAEKLLNQEVEKESKARERELGVMDRQIQKAQEFLERSKTLNQSQPNVQQGIQVANQIINEKDPAKVQELTDKLSVLKQGIVGTNSANLSFSEGMRRSITTVAEYALGAGLLYGALSQLRQGLKYIVDLNKEMTNIEVLGVPGATSDVEVNNLAKSYNTLASSLGVTTIEVAKGSVEWLRQGKTIAETEELLRSTMMLSKLGALDSAQATEYLTSTLNGFKMETSDASSVVDKLISVDNVAATSAGELSTALSYTAAVANQSNVSFDQMVGMIATVSSTTRASAESIGQSLNFWQCKVIGKIEALWYNKYPIKKISFNDSIYLSQK